MIFPLKQLAAALGLFALSSAAFAIPVTVDVEDNGGTAIQFRHGTEAAGASTIDILAPVDYSPRVTAGEFATKINDITGLFTFCLELEQELNNTPIEMNLVPLSNRHFTTQAQIQRLGRLYNNFYDDAVLNAANAAAFQVLIWEIKYDGANPIDLNAGTFQLNPAAGYAADINARNIAESWVSDVNGGGSPTLPFRLLELQSDDWQDLIIITGDGPPDPPAEAPAPATLALLGIGVLALARKRS